MIKTHLKHTFETWRRPLYSQIVFHLITLMVMQAATNNVGQYTHLRTYFYATLIGTSMWYGNYQKKFLKRYRSYIIRNVIRDTKRQNYKIG